MRIGIIGCGTAGPAAGIFLARAGHDVTLIERFAEPRPVGAGLLIQPVGQAILHDLGLLGELWPLAAPVRRLLGRTSAGRAVMDLRYDDLRADFVGMGIGRQSLFSTLLGATERAGVRTQFGADCRSVGYVDDGRGVRVMTADERWLGPFDLLVVADGARSALRPASLVRRNTQYPWGALWFTCDQPDSSFDGVLDQVYSDTRQMLGFLPIGQGRLAVFWSLPLGDAGAVRRGPLDAWKGAVRRLSARAGSLVDQVGSWDEVSLASYYDSVLSRWHKGRVVCIGDAGHAMSPQLGMGASLALVDASVLASCLASRVGARGGRSPGEDVDVGAALSSYTRMRRATLRYYQGVSRLLTPWFQSTQAWRGPIRDVGMPLATRVGPLRRQMLLGLVGAKQGWLSAASMRVIERAGAHGSAEARVRVAGASSIVGE